MDESTPDLDPYFEVIPARFTEYRELGGLKMAFEPWVLLMTALLAPTVMGFGIGSYYLPIGIVIAGLIFARRSAAARLQRAMDKYVRTYHASAINTGLPPHVIAHSLGAYLVGRAYQRHASIQYGRVVLYGCVLRRDFDWNPDRMPSETQSWMSRVDSVWNETGGEDFIPVIAEKVGRRVGLQFGGAGRFGFVGTQVHERAGALMPCQPCMTSGTKALVHNVRSEFSHSEAFVGGGHSKNVWRPFLLGYDPYEYQYVMRLCATCARLSVLNPTDLNIPETELRDYPWLWCGGELATRIQVMLEARPGRRHEFELPSLVSKVVGAFWARIALAQATDAGTRQSTLTSDDLDLHAALQNSIEVALSDV